MWKPPEGQYRPSEVSVTRSTNASVSCSVVSQFENLSWRTPQPETSQTRAAPEKRSTITTARPSAGWLSYRPPRKKPPAAIATASMIALTKFTTSPLPLLQAITQHACAVNGDGFQKLRHFPLFEVRADRL